MANNTEDAELRDILSKVLIDGQNQIHDLIEGKATPEGITERMFASLDYWTPLAAKLIQQEANRQKLELLDRLEETLAGEVRYIENGTYYDAGMLHIFIEAERKHLEQVREQYNSED